MKPWTVFSNMSTVLQKTRKQNKNPPNLDLNSHFSLFLLRHLEKKFAMRSFPGLATVHNNSYDSLSITFTTIGKSLQGWEKKKKHNKFLLPTNATKKNYNKKSRYSQDNLLVVEFVGAILKAGCVYEEIAEKGRHSDECGGMVGREDCSNKWSL